MKNIYFIYLFVYALLPVNLLHAQRKTGIDCDTINFPIPNNWTLTYYMVDSPAGDGYVAGTNEYNKQKANYFD